MSRMDVVLPAPLGPMKPYSPPRGIVRSRPATAVVSPNVLVTPRSVTAASALGAGIAWTVAISRPRDGFGRRDSVGSGLSVKADRAPRWASSGFGDPFYLW